MMRNEWVLVRAIMHDSFTLFDKKDVAKRIILYVYACWYVLVVHMYVAVSVVGGGVGVGGCGNGCE